MTTSRPDLSDQYEEILIEVWKQERFERMHPFTCAAIRRAAPESGAWDRSERRL